MGDLTDAQLQKIIAAIDDLKDHAPGWKPGIPIFIAALLSFLFALFLDYLKTRRELRKAKRERVEKELSALNGASTAVAFNIEALIHTTMQQIMPHYHQSNAAVAIISEARADPTKIPLLDTLLHSELSPMMRRSPIPYFKETELSGDFSFLLPKDPELLKIWGWVETFIFNLKFILAERNKLIDKATIDAEGDKNLDAIEYDAETQARVAGIEVVNVHQLFTTLLSAKQKIDEVIKHHYSNVEGAKLTFDPPPFLTSLMAELEAIVRVIAQDYPPTEPPDGQAP